MQVTKTNKPQDTEAQRKRSDHYGEERYGKNAGSYVLPSFLSPLASRAEASAASTRPVFSVLLIRDLLSAQVFSRPGEDAEGHLSRARGRSDAVASGRGSS